MTIEELRQEQAQLQASLDSWRQRMVDAQQQAANAQRQIDIHAGHLERIALWLNRMTDTAEQSDDRPRPREVNQD